MGHASYGLGRWGLALAAAAVTLLAPTGHAPGLKTARAGSGCVVFHGRYGSDAIAHVEGPIIFRGRYGNDAIAHIEQNVIFRGRYGSEAMAHLEGNLAFRGRYGSDVIARVEGQVIFRGRYGSDAIAHGDQCTPRELALAAAALF